MLAGLARVAALEAAELRWDHSTALPQQAAGSVVPPLPFKDVFGPCLAGGAYLAPRLLPAAAAAPTSRSHAAPKSAGATVVTGGLGALGLLLAAQQLAAGAAAGQLPPHLLLLGRRVDLAALEAGLGASWRAAVAHGSTALLAVCKCDAAAGADAAGLAAGLNGGGARVGRVVHAAGVLRVGELLLRAAAVDHGSKRAC
jgi:hypothetical protein